MAPNQSKQNIINKSYMERERCFFLCYFVFVYFSYIVHSFQFEANKKQQASEQSLW